MPLRSALVVLNELSLPEPGDGYEDDDLGRLLTRFVLSLRKVVSVRNDVAVVSPLPLLSTPLSADGLPLDVVAHRLGGRSVDEWRYLRNRQNISPYAAAPDLPPEDSGTSWSVGGRECHGLGLAAAASQISISFQSDTTWAVSTVPVLQSELLEHAGETEIVEQTLEVAHVSAPEHADEHRRFIADLTMSEPLSGEDLWTDCDVRYPRLRFLNRVRDQLCSLHQGDEWLSSIHDRLDELDQAVKDWRIGESPQPPWRSHVTPEHQQRRQLCEFPDEDGYTYCFDLHARFTPGDGRIHFRIDTDSAPVSLRIAHIGHKL